MIRVNRHSSELSESRSFDTVGRARHYAAGQVGPRPCIVADSFGTEYAQNDGVVLTVGGCSIRDLFPDAD
jgi:hypothetical protein